MTQLSDDTLSKWTEALNACLTRLEYSTARYLVTSSPYMTKADKDAMAAINEIAQAEGELANDINRFIVGFEGVPQLGNINPELAQYNYLSFPFILVLLIDAKKKEIDYCKGLVESFKSDPEPLKLAETVRDAHSEHLAKIEGIYDMRYKPAEPTPEPEESVPEPTEA